MFKKRVSTKAGVRIIATLLCAMIFLLIFAQSASASTPGDVNGDGKIDVKDVVLVQRHVLGLSTLTASQKALAIVKGFGEEPDARDVVLIMQRSIGKISSFPLPPTVTSPAFSTVTATNTVTITLTGGTFKAGTITAADFTFGGDNAVALAAGTFTRTSDTVVTISGLTLVTATNNTVTVKAATMAVRASSVNAASTITQITSPAFTTAATNNRVTITLTGGTFKAGTITAADFTFGGANAAALAGGIFTRVSDTVVTITVPATLAADTSNTVTVKAATMATQASSVAGAASTIPPVTSPAFITTAENNRVTITLTGGTFKSGTITAADFTFAGSNAAALALGAFTRTSDTVVTITVPAPLAADTSNTVTVKPTAMATQAISVTGAASTITAVISPAYITTAENNRVNITLTGGTFKSGTITAADFTFAGSNAAALALGAFTRTSDTVVTITVPAPLAADTSNTVTVKAATMATQASSVTGAASTITPVTSLAFPTEAVNNTVTITLTGGTFKSGTITAADFTFAGSNAAALALGAFTRTSDTVVTITGLNLAVATNNTVAVKAATMATQASSVAGAASTITTVTSPAFNTAAGNNKVTITLTGGTFKAGTITDADFTFAGANAGDLAAGTFTRTSNTVVTITGLNLAAATNNTVMVKAATMATQASSVAGAASTITAVTSPAFNTAVTNTKVTINLIGGTFKAVPIAHTDFIFAGTNQAALEGGSFARISNTVVTITVPAPLALATNNTVTVKAATMATQASSVAVVASD